MTQLQIKAAVRERDGQRCTECSMTAAEHVACYGKTLHVHRLKPGSEYTVEGCVTLCIPCHGTRAGSPPVPGNCANVLYVEIAASLKRRLVRLAEARARKISAEATLALERYVRDEEHKEGIAEDED
jgi:hypothetical protein